MIRTVFIVALMLAFSLLASGCAGRRMRVQSQVDAMRAETLEIEDRFYELQGRYDDLQRRYEQAQRQLGKLPEEGSESTSAGGDSVEGDSEPSAANPRDPDSRDELPGPQSRSSWPDGRPSGRAQSASQPQLVGTERGPRNQLRNSSEGNEAWQTPREPLAAEPPRDWLVTHVVINPLLTQGKNFDGVYGDDGFALVFEPRNADDQYVPLAGGLVISLIDPNESGEAQRIGLWELPVEDVESRVYGPGEEPQGIVLNLPWQLHEPRHNRLKLFLRYETDDGELLEASGDVPVVLPQSGISQWRPRETPLRQVSYDEPREPEATTGEAQPPRSVPSISAISQEDPDATRPPTVARPQWSPYRR